MCLNSISHSSSGSVLTSPSSWKEVGTLSAGEAQDDQMAPLGQGDQLCKAGVCDYRQKSRVVSASLAHDTELHHRLQAHIC